MQASETSYNANSASTGGQKNWYADTFMKRKHSSEINRSSNSTKKPVTVQVESEMIENLIKYLQNYNWMMSYKS